MNCRTCKFAFWQLTKNGRRHPSGIGQCTREVKMPQLPKAYYWIGGQAPKPSGGAIDWPNAEHYDGCQLWMDKTH